MDRKSQMSPHFSCFWERQTSVSTWQRWERPYRLLLVKGSNDSVLIVWEFISAHTIGDSHMCENTRERQISPSWHHLSVEVSGCFSRTMQDLSLHYESMMWHHTRSMCDWLTCLQSWSVSYWKMYHEDENLTKNNLVLNKNEHRFFWVM